MNVLFVTWDGPQVSYLESLFLPIFHRLSDHGIRFHVLQFTWGGDRKIACSRSACESLGISYRAVHILRKPLALGSLLTAFSGNIIIGRAIRDLDIDIVMPRSTLPALSTLLTLRNRSIPIVFDADGLPLDERVDFGGHSQLSLTYRFLRDIEAQAVRRADAILTRTGRAVDILHARAGAGTKKDKFYVVTNGRDPTAYTPGTPEQRHDLRKSLSIAPSAPLIVYAGSLGEQYCINEMFRFFEAIRTLRSDTRFLLLTGSLAVAKSYLKLFPGLENLCIIRNVESNKVSSYLGAADLGLALRYPSFSMQGVAPIKIGEYLLCGLPLLLARGAPPNAGDLPPNTSMHLNSFDKSDFTNAAIWFVQQVLSNRESYRQSTRAAGLKLFSLDASVRSYASALEAVYK